MILFSQGKWSGLILASYLAAAMLGTFTLSVTETFHFDEFRINRPASSGYFTSMDTIDRLAEDTAIISKSQKYSFSLLRYEEFRVFMPAGPQNTGKASGQSTLNGVKKASCFNGKNTILLKLRI